MDSFQESDSGLLYAVNGFDPMIRWDGRTSQVELAGIVAPTTAPVLSGSGVGGIVGTYTSYVRFLDRFGFVSNLSPISNTFVASSSGATGNITGATFAAPIVITSPAHGLTTGDIVLVSGVGGNTSANGQWSATVVDADDFSLDGSSGNDTYTGSGTWLAGISTITYTNVPVPTDPKVVRRQILRNTDGEASVYYVDIDTTNLTSTTFTSTQTDTFLEAGIAVSILDSTGLPLANLNYTAPSHKTSLASHLSRMFMAGQYNEQRGACIVTINSFTVVGVGTDWVATLAGRAFYVVGGTNTYQVSSVDTVNQIITLTTAYTEASDNFALYSIAPQPAEFRLVYYTPAGLPESWPPFYALSIQEDNDEITGLMARGSFLYIMEKRHIYKFTFQDDPAVDGAIFLSCNRGCINNRSWVLVDNDAYMLDEYGIHNFSSDGTTKPVSEQIGEIFRPGSLYKYGINWSASRYFHAVVYRPQETIRWFVALEGDYLPHHALAYNYRLQRWWIERYPFAVGGGCAGDINNIPYTFLSGESTKTYAMWNGTTDIAQADSGTVRGTVTSAGINWIVDSTANFAVSGIGSVINAPFVITDGTGKAQYRKVVAATATKLILDMPFLQTVDITSVYQVGGVVWNWKSTWMRLSTAETMADRNLEFLFETADAPCTMDVRTRSDFGNPDVQKLSITSKQGGGVRTDLNLPDKVVDLTKPTGVVVIHIPSHREMFTDGRRYFQVETAGVTNQDVVALYELVLAGMGNVALLSQGG